MSLVNNIGAAFIEAAEQAGVDPITFLQNMTQSGDKPVIVEKANDKADGVEKVSKRKYNRVVPEGSLRDLEVGTFGTDSLGRLHQVVEHRAFADKTRKARKWPMFRSRGSALFLPAKSLTLRWMPRLRCYHSRNPGHWDAETTDGESDSKPRRAYNRVVPDALSDAGGEIRRTPRA